MNFRADSIFEIFRRRRGLLAVLCLSLITLSFYLIYGLKIDKGLGSLLPDSSADLRGGAELMDLAPFARTILAQLSADGDQSALLLPSAADAFLNALDPGLMRPVDLTGLPEPVSLMGLLPPLCDSACQERLIQKTQPGQVQAALAELKVELAGPGGPASLFWRADPLGLRNELFKKFPARQAWPMPDPVAGYPVSDDGRRLLMVIKPLISMNDTVGSTALMNNLALAESALPSGLKAQIVAAHRHTAANAGAIERDLTLTLSLALVLILCIYIFLVRSLGAVWLFLTPAVAVLGALAGLTLVFPIISGLALGFGAAVLGIAEDYAVHVHYALRRSPDQKTALKLVTLPLLKSCLLCVAGFSLLMFSSVPAIRQLAFFSALAIAVGYLWAMVALPHCPGMNRPREFKQEESKKMISRADGRSTWMVFLGLTALSLVLIYSFESGVSIRSLGLSSQAINHDQTLVEKTWRLEGDRRIFLAEGNSLDEALKLAAQLTAKLNQAEAGSVSSLVDLIPPQEVQQKNLAGWAYFTKVHGPALKKILAEAGKEQGFSSEAFKPFLSWFDQEAGSISPEKLQAAGLGILSDNFLLEKDGRYFALVMAEAGPSDQPPGLDRVYELSAAGLEKSLSQALAGEKRLLPACILLCLGILIWSFKSAGQAALAFIPALGGLAAVLLFQKLSGRPLGLVEAASLPLVICLGADYGIVVVSELLENADLGAPRAIFVSGLSTIAGIGILILAQHPVLHVLGRTVFIGLLAAMPISILLLPRLYSGRTKDSA